MKSQERVWRPFKAPFAPVWSAGRMREEEWEVKRLDWWAADPHYSRGIIWSFWSFRPSSRQPHWPSQHALLLPPFPSDLFFPISFPAKHNCDWWKRFGAKARKGQQNFADAASSFSDSNCSSQTEEEIHSRVTTARPSPKQSHESETLCCYSQKTEGPGGKI